MPQAGNPGSAPDDVNRSNSVRSNTPNAHSSITPSAALQLISRLQIGIQEYGDHTREREGFRILENTRVRKGKVLPLCAVTTRH